MVNFPKSKADENSVKATKMCKISFSKLAPSGSGFLKVVQIDSVSIIRVSQETIQPVSPFLVNNFRQRTGDERDMMDFY